MMSKSTWSGQDHSEFYPAESKYQIGDQLANSDIFVRGVMTTKAGKHRYFLQIGDNSMVVDEEDLAPTLSVLTN